MSERAHADAGSQQDAAPDPDAPWEGPWIGASVVTAPVYSIMSRERDQMVGYLRHGTKAPGSDKRIDKSNCEEGWYHLHPYGYVCGRHATATLRDERYKSGITPPDLAGVVPYKYARNSKDGTPLYRRIPTRIEMEDYEPYLRKSDSPSATKAPASKLGGDSDEDTVASRRDGGVLAEADTQDAGAEGQLAVERVVQDGGLTVALPEAGTDGSPEQEALPWWQMDSDAGRPEVRLDDMAAGADHLLVRRMARGFFVAVDKTFRKSGRLWHKTTEGLLAPADRMSINSPPTFRGVELAEPGSPKLPFGFIRAEKAAKYVLEEEGKSFKRKGEVKRFEVVPFTGKTEKKGATLYRQAVGGWWLRANQVALTAPGPRPAEVRGDERWIDINLSEQTLVAFEGDRPVYATLISSGKKGPTKATDHSTVVGAFRVREKHVTATMDGDGAAPGEGPYSIQDVPYVMYFKGSYAIHGAFWHSNFGNRMSHGCVNLAPLDAKRLFFWVEPRTPVGWHGNWANEEHPGSLVVVHD
ncbi:MAG: L,D-transpeptidase [Polyangiaceae bacterium]|nr:L,D-transpeptidase [Polyangiaceae bacterium]